VSHFKINLQTKRREKIMSLQMYLILGAILALTAFVVTVSIAITKKVRAIKASRQLKFLQSTINSMNNNETYSIPISKNIILWVINLDVVCVIINSSEYQSITEALVYHQVNAFRRNQLLKIEKQLTDAYNLKNIQSSKVREVKQKVAVEKQETRQDTIFDEIDTTEHIEGKIYVYKPCEFIISNHLKAEIVKDEETGYMEIAMIWYAPAGNVKSPKALIPFDIRTASGSNGYAHYIENHPTNDFKLEAKAVDEIVGHLDKYNKIYEEGRISKSSNGEWIVQPPILKGESKDTADKADKEAKEVVEGQFIELGQVLPSSK
jgi:hypothetical protein